MGKMGKGNQRMEPEMRINFFLLVIAVCVQAIFAAKQTVAVLPSDGILSKDELEFLTSKAQEIAVNVLPQSSFEVFPQEVVIKRLGGFDSYVKECKESSCIVELGRKAMVDYVAQCRFGRFGSNLTIDFELYKVSTSGLIDKFTDDTKDINGLRAIMEKKLPDGFMKIPGASSRGKAVLPPVPGGIIDLERAVDYEFDDEKRYLANISTEPQGAALSFNGLPDDRCNKTPCKTEFPEGSVRIIARLEQYETADTTVSIKQNNQNIAIALKPNFGVLEINPAYSDGIGTNRQWNLAISDKSYSLGEIRLSPGSYEVKLSHECYENIGFKVGINKGKREVFDIARNISLKKGGLVLRAERNGEPASEPVFVNGRQVGETPFSGSVPLCAGIEIGRSREKVNVELKHNGKVEYVVHETREQRMERERQEAERRREAEMQRAQQERLERQRQQAKSMEAKKEADRKVIIEADRTSWHLYPFIAFPIPGALIMMNSIDSTHSGGGIFYSLGSEFFYGGADFIRLGLSMDLGFIFTDDDVFKRIHPDIDRSPNPGGLFKIGAFASLYPVSSKGLSWYLSGGAGLGYYGNYGFKTKSGDRISGPKGWAPVLSAGTGLVFFGALFLEGQYHMPQIKGRDARYFSICIGIGHMQF